MERDSSDRTGKKRICAIHQPHYLPWPRYFHKLAAADVFVLLDDVDFTRNGWQNRNRLKGANGPYIVTVPVRRSRRTIAYTEIADQRWQRVHLAALQASYGRSPGYSALSSTLMPLLSREWRYLADLNFAVVVALLDLLGISTPCVRSSELELAGTGSHRLGHICQAVGATHYLTGAHAAKAYLDRDVLQQHGIELIYQDWHPLSYRQPHSRAGFAPELSVVDLLAGEADDALALVRSGGRLTVDA